MLNATPNARPPLELWAGVECTVNRVGDDYRDQLEDTGHARRADDLDRFAALGVRTLRYPVLWERVAPEGPGSADWSWPDERLARLRALRVEPIVGLVHHGSGPRHTSLVSDDFPAQLAAYAGTVARRYPWVRAYTPVNEPLTTARFSGLYGHWFPHGRDDRTFAGALLNEVRGVVLAMRAVREVHPGAALVQTEDLGNTFSTPALAYQAEFENERRWLTWDLLTGRVDHHHPMWAYFRRVGVDERALVWFLDNPCPPAVVGINYYVTSERFLDECQERYPPGTHGGNGRHRYADVEAVRVRAAGLAGPGALLREAWQRYQLPLAFTEVHLGCSRDDQVRWLAEVWQAAQAERAGGADVRAVTVWSLLGLYDWNSLVTRRAGHYEPGVFDLRAPTPRPTALAEVVRDLAAGRTPGHPVLDTPGWWRRPERLHYPPGTVHPPETAAANGTPVDGAVGGNGVGRPVLITGAAGTLGQALAHACQVRGLTHRLVSRRELDVTDPRSIEACLASYRPWAVVNAAGYVRVDQAEREPDVCFRVNALGPALLAEACGRHGVALLTFSSDLVFDGESAGAYRESDAPRPLNVYGLSKAEAERRVLEILPSALVVRTSAFFGPWDESNFVTIALRALASGRRFSAAEDVQISPTYVPDLVHACLDMLIDREQAVWHLSNGGAVTWADLARKAAVLADVDPNGVEGRAGKDLGWEARRPRNSVLGSERGELLPSLDHALGCYFRHCPSTRAAPRTPTMPASSAGPPTSPPAPGPGSPGR